jgi:hypothetical protein
VARCYYKTTHNAWERIGECASWAIQVVAALLLVLQLGEGEIGKLIEVILLVSSKGGPAGQLREGLP